MFMTKRTAIDFHAWADEARQLKAPYEQQLARILERDRAYKEELCARGSLLTRICVVRSRPSRSAMVSLRVSRFDAQSRRG